MRIIVSDTSCMIDLRKAGLLRALLKLPYTFVMPDILFEDEWLCLSDAEKRALTTQGLEVRSLPGPSVARAQRHRNLNPRLKLNDCFALSLAEDIDDGLLLTGDGLLRRVAGECGVEARGVLWATDQLEQHKIVSLLKLHKALELFRDDALVFLPVEELRKRIRRLARKI